MNNKYIKLAGVSCGLTIVLILMISLVQLPKKTQPIKPQSVIENTVEKNDQQNTTTEQNDPAQTNAIIDSLTENRQEECNYTEDDLFCLAAAVCNEAGGSSEEIQLLVANVIINRTNSKYYPNTIRDVLTQRSQYGMMWKHGISFPKWATSSIKDQCYGVAERILNGERVCPENVLYQAEFKQGSGVFREYPGFYFCYRD